MLDFVSASDPGGPSNRPHLDILNCGVPFKRPYWRADAALPERRVTVHSGDMGYTIGPFARRAKCPGRSVTRWMKRVKFIAGLLDGEKMAVLCRRFGISRKTGYKILNRYNSCGLEGLTDRSRRPYRHANQLPIQI